MLGHALKAFNASLLSGLLLEFLDRVDGRTVIAVLPTNVSLNSNLYALRWDTVMSLSLPLSMPLSVCLSVC